MHVHDMYVCGYMCACVWYVYVYITCYVCALYMYILNVYVCVCICMYLHVWCMYIWMYNVYMMCAHVYIMCMWWCVYMFIMYVCMCVWCVLYDGVYVCMHVYIYVYDACMWWWSSEDNIVVFVLSFPFVCVLGLNSGHYVCMTSWTRWVAFAALASFWNQMSVQSKCLPPSPGRQPHLHKTHARWRVWAKPQSATLTFWGLAAAVKEGGCPSLTAPPGNQKQHGWRSLKWGEPMNASTLTPCVWSARSHSLMCYCSRYQLRLDLCPMPHWSVSSAQRRWSAPNLAKVHGCTGMADGEHRHTCLLVLFKLNVVDSKQNWYDKKQLPNYSLSTKSQKWDIRLRTWMIRETVEKYQRPPLWFLNPKKAETLS